MMTATENDASEMMIEWFEAAHLPEDQRRIVEQCAKLAELVVSTLPHNDESYVGLRKLLEAKDCFVRASISEVGLHRWLSMSRWKRVSFTDVP